MDVVSGRNGFALGPATTLDERSAAACALASFDHRLHLTWTGSDMRLNLVAAADGLRFGGKQTLNHRSSHTTSSGKTTVTNALGPALATTERGLHLAWTGTDQRVNVWPLSIGQPGPTVLRETSAVGPCLSAWGRTGAVLAWTGTDGHVNLAYSDGGPFGSAVRLPETTYRTPAVCAADTDVVVAWRGTDRHLNLLRSRDGVFAPPERLAETSSDGPALAIVDDTVVLAWTGTDRRLNLVATGRRGRRGSVLDAVSLSAPALAVHRGVLHLAWTARGHRPTVAPVRLPE